MYDRSGEFSAETMLHAASVAHDDFDDRPLGLSSLPPNIRASTTLALADLVHDCNSPSQNLEIALHQAADSGMLAQCVRSLNQGLQKAGQGLKLEEISHMPVGAPRAFNVTKTDQQGKLTLFVIDGFVERRPARLLKI